MVLTEKKKIGFARKNAKINLLFISKANYGCKLGSSFIIFYSK